MDAKTLTLRAWFALFEPVYLAGSKPATLREYRFTLTKWDALTNNPPLAEIDTMVLAAWQNKLLALPLARPTVNKHLRHVQHLLNKAGPAGPRNRDARSLLPASGWVRPLKCLKHLPAYLRPNQLNTLYAACEIATHPNYGVSPVAWWQTLIVLTYNLALRRGAALGLSWANVDFQNGLLHVPAEIDKRGIERLKPLNQICIRHLLRIRAATPLVFHWPHGQRLWYEQWRLLAAAVTEESHQTMVQTQFDFEHLKQGATEEADNGLNVRYPPAVASRTIHFHDLKRTAATVWAGHASPWAVRYMLDHGPGDVTGLYVDPTNELREKCESFPQPSAFLPDSTFSNAFSHGGENHGVVSHI